MVSFGVEGLTGGMARVSTVMCLESCEILHFTTFRMRLSGQGVQEFARKAFASFVEEELRKMPLFFGLKSLALFDISAMFEFREYGSANTPIYSAGTPADELQLVKLQAGSDDDGLPFFGERSLLEGGTRTTSATTRTPCKLLVLHKANFARIVKLMPELKSRLQEFYDLRLSRAQLARLAAADKQQRRALERRARLRDKAIKGESPDSPFSLDSERGEDGETTASAISIAQRGSDAEPAQQAAEHLQRIWRGTSVRKAKQKLASILMFATQ
jgi:CRP-like cAMP-binding protein